MQTKLLVILGLMVLLPLTLLGGFGIRFASNEQEVIEYQFQVLVDAQLQAVDAAIQTYFSELEAQLLVATESMPETSDALRAHAREQPRVRQILLMDEDGERLHPPPNAPLGAGEQRFMARTENLWTDKDILYQSHSVPAPRSVTAPAKTSLFARTAPSADDQEQDYGWYVWSWGQETNLIFWRRTAEGRLLGLELEPVRVLADIISRLPATGGPEERLGAAAMRLTDGRGTVAYQWGEFQPAPNQTALAVLPLSHPLGSWRLAYYAPGVQTAQGRLWLIVLAALSAVAGAVCGLAIYVYREHTCAVRLAQQRVNFVNQVSHELKTPLTNIRMYAELLEDQLDEEDDEPRRYLDVIVTESQRLSRLINNVLNFARQQKNRLRLRVRTACADEVIGAALAAFRPALEAKGVRIVFRPGAGAPVELDPDVLEQILNNLLSNIEKYAADGGLLEIDSHQCAAQTRIRVRDYGPGIPRHERERIFQPFYRISSKLTDGVSGAGIGLAITRELARLHGGELTLIPVASGACFEVTLHTLVVEE